jgi:quercetin dioxygenase-like cupin family protein
MNQYRVDFESAPLETPMSGLRFKAVAHGGRRLRLVEYTKDMEPHWCDKGHVGYILEGRFEIRFDRVTEIFNPGDGVFIPPGEEHRHMARAITEVVRAVFVEDV